jgi:hypothetical protein
LQYDTLNKKARTAPTKAIGVFRTMDIELTATPTEYKLLCHERKRLYNRLWWIDIF